MPVRDDEQSADEIHAESAPHIDHIAHDRSSNGVQWLYFLFLQSYLSPAAVLRLSQSDLFSLTQT